MFRTVRRTVAATVAATGVVVLAAATLASAHIETDPPAVAAGQQATVGFVVEHGCGDNDTTGLDIKLPASVTDATAAKDGWQTTVTDGVVRFTDGTLDHHTTGTFEISFTAPTTPGVLAFPTVQRCGDTEQPWLDEVVEGQPEPEHPTPQLLVTQGPPTSDELTEPTDDDGDDDAAGATTVAATTAAPTTASPTTATPTTATPTTAAATTAAPTTAAATTAAPTTTAASTTTAATTTTVAVTTTTEGGSSDDSNKTAYWIGAGIAVVIAAAGVIVALRWRRERNDDPMDGPTDSTSGQQN